MHPHTCIPWVLIFIVCYLAWFIFMLFYFSYATSVLNDRHQVWKQNVEIILGLWWGSLKEEFNCLCQITKVMSKSKIIQPVCLQIYSYFQYIVFLGSQPREKKRCLVPPSHMVWLQFLFLFFPLAQSCQKTKLNSLDFQLPLLNVGNITQRNAASNAAVTSLGFSLLLDLGLIILHCLISSPGPSSIYF